MVCPLCDVFIFIVKCKKHYFLGGETSESAGAVTSHHMISCWCKLVECTWFCLALSLVVLVAYNMVH